MYVPYRIQFPITNQKDFDKSFSIAYERWVVPSDSGDVPTVTPTTDGLMLSTDKVKLDDIEAEATKNASDADLRARSSHTGTQAISTVSGLQTALDAKAPTAVVTTTVNGLMAFADKVKLNGIATAATANATDAQLRDRSTHTGSQAISTITNLQTTLNGKLTGTQQAAIAPVAVSATTGSLPVAGGSVVIADASAPTADELLSYCRELETKLSSVITTLASAGVTL